jgi:hypothetical protein
MGVAVGGGDGNLARNAAGKHGRYRTSTRAIVVLVEALKKQGVIIGDMQQLQLVSSSRLATTTTTIADICGTPLDTIFQFF